MAKMTIKANEKANWTKEEKALVKLLSAYNITVGQWNKMSEKKQVELLQKMTSEYAEFQKEQAEKAEAAAESTEAATAPESTEEPTENAPEETVPESTTDQPESDTPEPKKPEIKVTTKVLYEGRKLGTIYKGRCEYWVYDKGDKPAELWVFRKYMSLVNPEQYKTRDRGAAKVCVWATSEEHTLEALKEMILAAE